MHLTTSKKFLYHWLYPLNESVQRYSRGTRMVWSSCLHCGLADDMGTCSAMIFAMLIWAVTASNALSRHFCSNSTPCIELIRDTVQLCAIQKRPIAKMAQKILMPKNCSKRPIAMSKTAHHTTKTAHSKVQDGPQLHSKRPIVIIGIWQRPKRPWNFICWGQLYTG